MIQKNKFDLITSDTNALKIYISVNISSCYLQVLLCKELLTIASKQVMICNEILRKARMLHAMDKNKRANVVEAEAAITSDKLVELRYKNRCEILMLSPSLGTYIFYYASLDYHLIMSNKYKVESMQQGISISKSVFYPVIILQTDYENSYYYSNLTGYSNSGFSSQLRKYGNGFVGISGRNSIFDQLQTFNNIKSNRLNNIQAGIQLDESYLELKKEIELAYQDAVGIQKKIYVATKIAEDKAIIFADEERKFMLGKLTNINICEVKKQLLGSQSEEIQTNYKYVFSLKIVSYNNGKFSILKLASKCR